VKGGEQVFYKVVEKRIVKGALTGRVIESYVEATEADLAEAGYVKREKVDVYYDGLCIRCCGCESILEDDINYCHGCGSELVWEGE
jgi:hypothetical protein